MSAVVHTPAARTGIPGVTELHMRKKDGPWLIRSAQPGGCPLDACPTAFTRLERLGFISTTPNGCESEDFLTDVAWITPAGVEALAKLAWAEGRP